MEFFSGLFTSVNPHHFEKVFEGFQPRVSSEMNDILMQPFNHEDVRVSLFQMTLSKAPEPNGMNANFFQGRQHLRRRDVADYVLSVIKGMQQMEILNATHIALIRRLKIIYIWHNFILLLYVMLCIRLSSR